MTTMKLNASTGHTHTNSWCIQSIAFVWMSVRARMCAFVSVVILAPINLPIMKSIPPKKKQQSCNSLCQHIADTYIFTRWFRDHGSKHRVFSVYFFLFYCWKWHERTKPFNHILHSVFGAILNNIETLSTFGLYRAHWVVVKWHQNDQCDDDKIDMVSECHNFFFLIWTNEHGQQTQHQCEI